MAEATLLAKSAVAPGADQDPRTPLAEYTPESPLRHPLRMARQIAGDLVRSRGLAWRLLVRNLSQQYRQTMLGYAWAFLPPLATTGIWVFLNSQRIVQFDSPGVPYPAFVLTGMVLWQTFVDAIQAPQRVVSSSTAMLAKINFPREALLLVALGEVLFNFLIRLLLLLGVFLWFGLSVPGTVLLAPLAVASLIAVGFTIGLLLLPVGVLYQDVGHGVGLVTQFWLYLTPVVYMPPQTWPASLINWLNPASPALLVSRDWLIAGATEHLPAFAVVSLGAAAMLAAGIVGYRLTMPILIERMSA